jgi:branched-chain amino acid transport system permease protein
MTPSRPLAWPCRLRRWPCCIALPAIAPRAVVQDLFGILTLLVLAMNWNMLAGFAGLVSVGQQAFVGIGAYAMFAAIILMGLDPLAGVLIGGIAAALFAIPMAFFAFRLNGAYFAIGTWVVADIARLAISQWKALGGGTGTSLPKGTAKDMAFVDQIKEMLDVSSAAAADALTYWLMLSLAVAMLVASYVFLRSRMGLGCRRSATTRTPRGRWGWTPEAEGAGLPADRLRHRPLRRRWPSSRSPASRPMRHSA